MNDGLTVTLSAISSRADLALLWRGLDRRGGNSFFTAWPWIGTWLELLPPSIAPQVLRLERAGECQGSAIAVRRDARRHGVIAARGLHLNETGDPAFDCLTVEHNGFAGRDPGDAEAWRAVIAWFAAGGADADELSLPGIAAAIAIGEAPSCGLGSEREVDAFRVDLAALRQGDGKIGALLSANARQQLARATRALKAIGPLALDAATSVAEGLAFFDELKRLHIGSWSRRGRRHSFEHPFFERFHQALISTCITSGEVELLRLRAGARAFGYLYNLRRDGHVYAYQSGFDDEDRRLRPGYVAHALAIELHAATGASCYDFMAGSNRLKASFANERYSMRWYTIQRPLLRFKAERAARAVKSRLMRPRQPRPGADG
jgi:CelD/BcsL family acetyltransferase involved in cellulose biosynthesis